MPVIVSRQVNLAPEIEAAGAGWVTSLDHDTLEQTLLNAMVDSAERALRGAAGRELALRRFSWEAAAKQLLSVYEESAQNAPAGAG